MHNSVYFTTPHEKNMGEFTTHHFIHTAQRLEILLKIRKTFLSVCRQNYIIITGNSPLLDIKGTAN